MFWIFIAFLSPLFYAATNVFDNYFVNLHFKNPITLIFFASVFNIVFLPFILLIQTPALPTMETLPFFMLIGAIDVIYLYPYYRALQEDDTSNVLAFFYVGSVFVPIFAYFIANETLTLRYYMGFFLLIISWTILSLNKYSRPVSTAAILMILCSLLVSIELVVYRYIFASVSWSTGVFWSMFFATLFVLPIFFVKKQRQSIIEHIPRFKRCFHLFLVEELFAFLGLAAYTYAVFLVPATLVRGIGALQPFILLVLAIFLGKFFPFKEGLSTPDLVKKSIAFFLIVIGVFLIVK